jgi:recombination protein RecA
MSATPASVSVEELSRSSLQLSWTRSGRTVALPHLVPASRLADRPAPVAVFTGIAELDRLTGGLPRGALSEICGPASSGRTSVLLALMASLTAGGELCALVDATDSFHPKSAQAAGVDLRRLLWVRCSNRASIAGARCSMAAARSASIDRRPSTLDRMEQALKATDLLLQGGGFGLVAVDLGDVPAQAARRVPLTSWFRFRRAVENTSTVLAVMEQEPYARTCASVVVKMSAVASRRSAAGGQWSVAGGQKNDEPPHARIFSGLEITAEAVRSAAQGKKPVRSEGVCFASQTAWAG